MQNMISLAELLGHAERSTEVPSTKRIVYVPQRGKKNLSIQPKPGKTDKERAEREMQENLNRMEFVNHYHYEDPHTPHLGAKTYNPDVSCGNCNHQWDGKRKDGCTFIPIRVHLRAGSCKHYAEKCAGVREIDISEIGETAESAAYNISKPAFDAIKAGKSPEGLVFTCNNCPFASDAFEPDSLFRDKYCGLGDFRVFGTACCEKNGQEVVSEYEGNEPVKEDEDEEKY